MHKLGSQLSAPQTGDTIKCGKLEQEKVRYLHKTTSHSIGICFETVSILHIVAIPLPCIETSSHSRPSLCKLLTQGKTLHQSQLHNLFSNIEQKTW
jgi:hypothetical protein